MKRNLILCAIAAVVLSACAREIVPEYSGNVETITFTAEAPAQTKTVLEDGVKVYWCYGDIINVSGATTPFVSSLKEGETASSVTFTGEVEVADEYYAVYPSVEDWNGSIAYMTANTVQRAETGTFGELNNITVAKTSSEDLSFSFKNILGHVKFTSNEAEAGYLRNVNISSIAGESLSGGIIVDCAEDSPVAEVIDGRSYVTSTFAYKPAGDYYISMLPGDYSEGLVFDFVRKDGYVATVRAEHPLSLEAGFINPIGSIDNLEWTDPSEGSEYSIWKGKSLSGYMGNEVCADLGIWSFDWTEVTPGDYLKIYGGPADVADLDWHVELRTCADWGLLADIPEKFEKEEVVTIELTENILEGIVGESGVFITGIDYCLTNVEIVPAEVENPEDPIIPGEGETVIWEGKFVSGTWGGNQDLAYGKYDWSQHNPGDVLKIYGGPTDPEAENWVLSLRVGDDNWDHLAGVPQYLNKVYDYTVTLTQDMIDDLVARNGLIVQGDNYTMRMITVKEGEISEDETGETTLWEGESYVTWSGGAVTNLSYGGYDWSKVEPGTILKVYLTSEEGGSVRVAVGEGWTSIPSFKKLAGYNAEWDLLNLGTSASSVSVTLTEEDIENLVSLNGLVVCGDKITVTKIVLTEYVPTEVTIWEGEADPQNYAVNLELGGDDNSDWRNVNLQVGQKVRIYFDLVEAEEWSIQLFDGHWGAIVLPWETNQFNSGNADVNLGYVEFDVTETIHAQLVAQNWWGKSIILQGQGIIFTKITVIQ